MLKCTLIWDRFVSSPRALPQMSPGTAAALEWHVFMAHGIRQS